MSTFTVIPVPAMGAEDVVVGTQGADEGAVFTGTADGGIFRISHDAQQIRLVARTGGRPLGIEIDLDGRLLVADAKLGLLRIDTTSGRIETVADRVLDKPMVFCNNAAIASSGSIFFSDSSTKFGIEQWKDDFVRNTCTGRLLRLDPGGGPQVVLSGLAFANGVALSKAEDYVVVAETGARTLKRLWLTGERAGASDYLAQDLPGYPDNIATGSDGLIWVTIASPINPLVERLHTAPLAARKVITRIPERLQPKPAQTVRVQAYDDHGTVVHDIDVTPSEHGAAYHMVTGVREHDGVVWMGSLHEPAIAAYRV